MHRIFNANLRLHIILVFRLHSNLMRKNPSRCRV